MLRSDGWRVLTECQVCADSAQALLDALGDPDTVTVVRSHWKSVSRSLEAASCGCHYSQMRLLMVNVLRLVLPGGTAGCTFGAVESHPLLPLPHPGVSACTGSSNVKGVLNLSLKRYRRKICLPHRAYVDMVVENVECRLCRRICGKLS
jgi:hypothetical protein